MPSPMLRPSLHVVLAVTGRMHCTCGSRGRRTQFCCPLVVSAHFQLCALSSIIHQNVQRTDTCFLSFGWFTRNPVSFMSEARQKKTYALLCVFFWSKAWGQLSGRETGVCVFFLVRGLRTAEWSWERKRQNIPSHPQPYDIGQKDRYKVDSNESSRFQYIFLNNTPVKILPPSALKRQQWEANQSRGSVFTIIHAQPHSAIFWGVLRQGGSSYSVVRHRSGLMFATVCPKFHNDTTYLSWYAWCLFEMAASYPGWM